MEDEAQAEAETDTEAPSDICRLHPTLRSRAGSQLLLLLLPQGLREAKQKADRAIWNAKSRAKRNLDVARVQRANWIQGPFGLERTFLNGSVHFSQCTGLRGPGGIVTGTAPEPRKGLDQNCRADFGQPRDSGAAFAP